MSNQSEDQSTDQEKAELIPSELPKGKAQQIMQEFEIMAMQKAGRNTLDISKFDKDQINKLLEAAKENESNAFAFHTLRINAMKEIELKRIDASVVNQKTIRYLLWFGILIVVPLLTVLILFLKEAYFIPWLTFITGLIGGAGLNKSLSGLFKQPDAKNPISEDAGE